MCQLTSSYLNDFSKISLWGMKLDVHYKANAGFEKFQTRGLLSVMTFCRITGCREKQCRSIIQKRKFSARKVLRSHLPIPT